MDGSIPAELDGWYLRNGANPWQPTAHWFAGDGMIHGVRIEGGAKWYPQPLGADRELREAVPAVQRRRHGQPAPSVANTHDQPRWENPCAGGIFASYQITNDLETVGCYDFDGRLNDAMTAHPKICPTTGELRSSATATSSSRTSPAHHRADADGTSR